ncbi:Uma2 family endonuclease [Gammaproteobacteria bacterium]
MHVQSKLCTPVSPEVAMSVLTTTISETVTRRKLPRTQIVREIVYPDSDEEPMAENTRQFEIIVTLHTGISALFVGRPDVFVAGDLFWYPVEGSNTIRLAPDVMVVFGRPPGHRGSYRQWCEAGIAPQVVFEILSPDNRAAEMSNKFRFYERYGVKEYYIYDPDYGRLDGWLRHADQLNLEEVPEMEGWVSPRLGIRFHLDGTELVVYRPDGRRFETALEIERRAEVAEYRIKEERWRAQRLADQLRALGIDPDAV